MFLYISRTVEKAPRLQLFMLDSKAEHLYSDAGYVVHRAGSSGPNPRFRGRFPLDSGRCHNYNTHDRLLHDNFLVRKCVSSVQHCSATETGAWGQTAVEERGKEQFKVQSTVSAVQLLPEAELQK